LPVGLGAFGFLAAFAGSWVPSFWGDEAASVMSAERSLPSLFAMLKNVDAVHGVYYLFLHFWIQAFGASEVSVRLPSAIAVGVMVAGTFVLGRMLVTRNVGIIAAVVSAVLPRTSYMGADARSYALSSAIAVWVTVLFVVLLRRRSTSRTTHRLAWLAYAVALAAGIYLFLYLGLLLLVHGAFLFTTRSYRRNRRSWAEAAGLTIVLALPILGVGYAERGQIAFLAHRGYTTATSVLVTQWFGKPVLAIVAWALVSMGIVGAAMIWRRTREVSPLVRLSVVWVLLPTLALLALNAATPAYNLRYLSFCVPGVALAITAGIRMLRSRAARIAIIVVLVACAIPTDVAQRGPFAKDGGSDLAQAAAYIGRAARPGDGIIFDRTTANRQRPRLAEHLYPSDFTGLQDVALKTSYLDRSRLWDTTYPTSDITPRLEAIDRVWVVELTGSPDDLQGTDIHSLEGDGYLLTSSHLVHRTIIYSLVRPDVVSGNGVQQTQSSGLEG
jgi:mannosyltransferase